MSTLVARVRAEFRRSQSARALVAVALVVIIESLVVAGTLYARGEFVTLGLSLVGACIAVASIALTWLRIVGPTERATLRVAAELRDANAAYLAQVERITELYRVAAFANQSAARQLRETLAVAAQRLGYDWAIAIEASGGIPRTVASVGDLGFDDDEDIPISTALIERAKDARDVWSIDDVSKSRLFDEATIRNAGWMALVGTPIVVGATTFGTLVLGAGRARARDFVESDRDFLRLVAVLIAASIQRGQHEKQLGMLAFTDALTGLANRIQLAERMNAVIDDAALHDRSFAVHCLDLDRFKPINDAFGHAAGDEILRIVAHRMMACSRTSDVVARVGGDEFVIVQPLDASGRGANELADRIIAALGKPIAFAGRNHCVGVSIGIGTFPRDGSDAQTLLRAADDALLRAKRTGRNRWQSAAS